MQTGRARVALLLAAVVLLLTVALILLRPGLQTQEGNHHLFPELSASLPAIARIEVESRGGKFNLLLENQWFLGDGVHYPADTATVHGFLRNIARLQIKAKKTSNPDRLGEIGLAPLNKPESTVTVYRLFDQEQELQAAIAVGKVVSSKLDRKKSDLFVRRGENLQSYLVEGNWTALRRPIDWVENTLLKIDLQSIQQVVVENIQNPTEPALTVTRSAEAIAAGQADFKLLDLAANETIADQYALNEIANVWDGMQFDQWMKISDLPIGPGQRATLQTYAGDSIGLLHYQIDDTGWIVLQPHLVESDSENRSPLQKAVLAQAALWQEFAYRLPPYLLDAIFKPRAELIEVASTPE